MDGGNGRGSRQGIRLGESWKLTVCMGALLKKTLMSSVCRKLWGAHVDIHPLLRRVRSTVYAAVPGRRHGQGLGPPEKRLRTGESRAVIMMLCMSLWPGFRAAVKPRAQAHVLTAARKHGDAHN